MAATRRSVIDQARRGRVRTSSGRRRFPRRPGDGAADRRPDGERRRDEAGHARGRGQRGSALVVASLLLFSLTAGGVIWLSRDVNRKVSNRTAAQSVAFQAARAGAQQVDTGDLRQPATATVELEPNRVRSRAEQVATQLFGEYGVEGSVLSVEINGEIVTVRVEIVDPVGTVTGVGSAEAVRG